MSQAPFDLGQRVRTMQILWAGIVIGAVVFAIVVVAVGSLNQPPQGNILSLVGVVFTAMDFVAFLVMPGIMAKNAAAQLQGMPEEERWCGIYQTKLIIGLALLEGVVFLNLIACMQEHNWWSLAIAGGLVLLMLLQFPTRTRLEQWIETQRMNNP
jgi:hypothetical protein